MDGFVAMWLRDLIPGNQGTAAVWRAQQGDIETELTLSLSPFDEALLSHAAEHAPVRSGEVEIVAIHLERNSRDELRFVAELRHASGRHEYHPCLHADAILAARSAHLPMYVRQEFLAGYASVNDDDDADVTVDLPIDDGLDDAADAASLAFWEQLVNGLDLPPLG